MSYVLRAKPTKPSVACVICLHFLDCILRRAFDKYATCVFRCKQLVRFVVVRGQRNPIERQITRYGKEGCCLHEVLHPFWCLRGYVLWSVRRHLCTIPLMILTTCLFDGRIPLLRLRSSSRFGYVCDISSNGTWIFLYKTFLSLLEGTNAQLSWVRNFYSFARGYVFEKPSVQFSYVLSAISPKIALIHSRSVLTLYTKQPHVDFFW